VVRALTSTCLLVVSSLLLLLGCAEVPGADSIPACKGGKAEPISIKRVRATLRSHGFTAEPEEREAICGPGEGPEAVAVITNSHFDGPFENIHQHAEIARREGVVICAVRRSPLVRSRADTLQKDFDAPAASPIFNGKKAEFYLANVECTIYPEGDQSGQQVAALDAAMVELEASLRK
jgi:hypothetical protein